MLPRDVMHIVLCCCEEANSPRAVTVAVLARYGEMDQLVSLVVDPAHYLDAESFFRDNQVTELLRKCDGLDTTFDKEAEARLSFLDSEHGCYRTNERLTPYLFGACPGYDSGGVREVISLAQKYVRHVLGACPDLPEGRFGPGATFADRGQLTTVPDKMSSRPTLTSASLGVLPHWARTAWARSMPDGLRDLSIVRGNRFTTVPKDARKVRGIAVEPSLNVFYQLGVGSAIRQRLRRVGIDLQYGQDVHRAKARFGSLSGDLATIDLSSASDTVCRALVELLLPESWFRSLDSLRSPFTQVDGHWHRLEKFSSMGNGFTFELETLLFLAISFSVLTLGGHMPREGINLLVYGDDIIVPAVGAPDVISALRFFGFTPNRRKTFWSGAFRESCGGDYFGGVPVRAFNLKSLPEEPHEWISFANGLRRVCTDHNPGQSVLFLRTWHRVLDQVPSSIRVLRGPVELGDIVIHDESERCSPVSIERDGRRRRVLGPYDPRLGDGIRYYRTWSPVNPQPLPWAHWRAEVGWACALYGAGDGEKGVTPRSSVSGHVERWVPFS
nr:MAG: RNA replicase beta chain [Sanya fiers-like virus 19]